MNKSEIINMLDDLEIKYRLINHPAIETIEAGDKLNLPDSDVILKNLFLRDDKKRNYYLVSLRKDKMVNLKNLQCSLNSRRLSFASENDLSHYLGLKTGSVTPLGVLNDIEHKVKIIIDEDVVDFSVIGIHPNENTAMLWIAPQDMCTILKDNKTSIDIIKI